MMQRHTGRRETCDWGGARELPRIPDSTWFLLLAFIVKHKGREKNWRRNSVLRLQHSSSNRIPSWLFHFVDFKLMASTLTWIPSLLIDLSMWLLSLLDLLAKIKCPMWLLSDHVTAIAINNNKFILECYSCFLSQCKHWTPWSWAYCYIPFTMKWVLAQMICCPHAWNSIPCLRIRLSISPWISVLVGD